MNKRQHHPKKTEQRAVNYSSKKRFINQDQLDPKTKMEEIKAAPVIPPQIMAQFKFEKKKNGLEKLKATFHRLMDLF
jgi:hypothetical protein